MTGLVLYGAAYSVYVRIARVALAEKSVPYRLEEIDIYSPAAVPENYGGLHPFKRIPTLVHDGFVLYETGAITRYIDEAFPGISLQPANLNQRARMNQLISIIDHYGYRPMIWGVYTETISAAAEGRVSDTTALAIALDQSELCLKVVSGILDKQAFLAGEDISLADIHAAPILTKLRVSNEGQQLINRFPNIEAWLSHMSIRSSMASTAYKGEKPFN